MDENQNLKIKYRKHLINCLRALILPAILALIFALQNYIFNSWLGISSNAYSGRFFAVTFGLGMILYCPAILFKRRGRYVWIFVVAVFVSIIFISQFIYFEYSQSFLQFSAIRYMGQAGSVLSTAKTMISFRLLIFLINLFFVIFIYFYTRKKGWREVNLLKREKLIGIILIILAAFVGYDILIKQETKEWGNTSRLYGDVYDLNTLVEKIGIVNFSIEDVFKFFAKSNLITEMDKNFLKNFAKTEMPALSTKNASPSPPTNFGGNSQETSNRGGTPKLVGGKFFGVAKGKNIIIIQVESLEASVIGQSISGQEITPNLNNLAASGMFFNNYYTQVGPGNTADAEFSTMNSLYPLQDDVAFVDYAQNKYDALPKLLDKNGYHSYAFHADVPTFWNRANIYPNLGYQKQFSEDDYVKSRSIGKGPSDVGDEDFLLQSLDKLKNLKQPFLSTLITISSHTPFELPQDLQTLNIPSDGKFDWWQYEYLESVHYADMAMGEFIDGLKKENLYDNSIIVIYGDHGSFTGTTVALENPYNVLPTLTNKQVPLIILNVKGLDGVNNAPMSHLDLYPTIANLLGITSPKTILGQDIFNTERPVVVYRNILSGTINTILTDSLAFEANADGVFTSGICFKMPTEQQIPVENCRSLYNTQSDTVKASDIIVRGNLLQFFSNNLKN